MREGGGEEGAGGRRGVREGGYEGGAGGRRGVREGCEGSIQMKVLFPCVFYVFKNTVAACIASDYISRGYWGGIKMDHLHSSCHNKARSSWITGSSDTFGGLSNTFWCAN